MTDPNALLQHILSAVEKIQASQQCLQQGHLDLEAKFAALALNIAPQAPPAPLPECISAVALDAPISHPYLPDQDRLYAVVLQLAHQLVTPDVDGAVLQSAYTELAARVADAAADSHPPSEAKATSSSSGTYAAKSGRRFDTSKPPPYPCRRCGQRHWVAGPGVTPCPSRTASFSRRGAHSPAPAPRSSTAAGSQ